MMFLWIWIFLNIIIMKWIIRYLNKLSWDLLFIPRGPYYNRYIIKILAKMAYGIPLSLYKMRLSLWSCLVVDHCSKCHVTGSILTNQV